MRQRTVLLKGVEGLGRGGGGGGGVVVISVGLYACQETPGSKGRVRETEERDIILLVNTHTIDYCTWKEKRGFVSKSWRGLISGEGQT